MNPSDSSRETAARVDGMSAARLLARALQPPSPPQMAPEPEWPTPDALTGMMEAYEVLELIGRGGMGAVYRARQKSLDRMVAVKILPLEASLDENFAARFQREARLLARLQHPHIVAVHDSGTTADGRLFLVMELVEGSDLSRLIRTGQLSFSRSLEILERVCDALEYAHKRGVIHRDIKPSNILISSVDGTVKVADFGLAKLRDGVDTTGHGMPEPRTITMTGTVMGTPEYMAPEQGTGNAVDQRADIYSVGVLFYEMLTGRLPRGAWEPPSRRSGVDRRVDAMVTKALRPEPADRYLSVTEMKGEIETISDHKTHRSRVWPWVAGGAAAVIVTATLVWNPLPIPEVGKKIEGTRVVNGPEIDVLLHLDLAKEELSGRWNWLDDKPGGVLVHGLSQEPGAKRIRLPLAAPNRSYELSFEFQLAAEYSDGGIVFPVGASRTGLLLNLQRISGLGLVRGLIWNNNETSTRTPIAPLEWHPVKLTVHLDDGGESASVAILLDGVPFMEWQGSATDLTLYEVKPDGWAIPGEPGQFGVATYGGGFSMRNVRFRGMERQ